MLCTFRLEVDVFDFLGTWLKFGVNVQLSTSSGDEMTVLQKAKSWVTLEAE